MESFMTFRSLSLRKLEVRIVGRVSGFTEPQVIRYFDVYGSFKDGHANTEKEQMF
jgi:hypothetical protein